MSIELISVLIAVVAIGATLGGLILISNRGLRQDMREDMGKLRQDIKDLRGEVGELRERMTHEVGETPRNAWHGSKGCWKGCARPSPDGSRLARGACARGVNVIWKRQQPETAARGGARDTRSRTTAPHKLVFSRGWARRWAPSGPG